MKTFESYQTKRSVFELGRFLRGLDRVFGLSGLSVFGLMVSLLLAGCAGQENELQNANLRNDDISAIIGGQKAFEDEQLGKTVLAIVYERNGAPAEYCTGTLIAPGLLVTAAHCFENWPKETSWLFYGERLPKSFSEPGFIEIQEVLKHPNYGERFGDDQVKETDLNDVALVAFSTSSAKLALKPATLLVKHQFAKNQDLVVAGFGHINDMVTRRADTLYRARVKFDFYWQNMIIVDQKHGAGVCRGDSGGPLFVEDEKGQTLLVGTVRGAHNRSNFCLSKAQFNNLADFVDFIRQGAKALGRPQPKIIP